MHIVSTCQRLFNTERLFGLFLLACWTLCCTYAAAQTSSIRLGKAYVLSSSSTEMVIEVPATLPVAPDMRTTVQLASPQAHTEKGLSYPRWLSDAAFYLKQGTQQRPVLRITPQRGNKDLHADLLLDISLQGQRFSQPYHLYLEELSLFEGKPIPAHNQPPMVLPSFGAASTQNTTPQQSQTVTVPPPTYTPDYPAKKKPYASHNPAPKRSSNHATRSVPPAAAPVQLAAPVQPATVEAAAPAPLPQEVLAAPAAPAQLIAAAPSPVPLPSVSAHSKPASSSWTNGIDWQMWAIGALLLFLLGYLIYRLWQALRARQAKNAPLLTRETGFRPSNPHEQSVNTVFGVSDKEANDLHQQWFNQQNSQNVKK